MRLRSRFTRLGGALAVVLVVAAATPLSAQASSGQPVVQGDPQLQWGCAWDCGYVKNAKVVSYPKYNVAGAYVQGWGPQTLNLNFTQSTSNGWSATVGFDVGIIRTAVGFNVTQTMSVNLGTSVPVPAGKCWGVQGRLIFQNWTYELWSRQMVGDDVKIGTGTAWRFYGVDYLTLKPGLFSNSACR